MTAPSFQVTQEQRNFFNAFGFLKFPGLFADDIADITRRFDQVYDEAKDMVVDWVHETHYGKLRRILPQLLEHNTGLASLLDDPRIDGIFSALAGDHYIYHNSQGDIFTGDTRWHSDLYSLIPGYRYVKIALYLDPMDADSGAFRVLPGSQFLNDGYGKQLGRFEMDHQKKFGITANEVPSVVVPTVPGDLLVFNFALKHATCNSTIARRMLTVAAIENIAEPEHLLTLGQQSMEVEKQWGYLYRPALLENAPASRMRHLQQKLDSMAMAKQTASPV